jgi:translocation and assembly module TamA
MSSHHAALAFAMLALFAATVHAATTRTYQVHFESTEDSARDAALEASSQLETLRNVAPVDAAGLLARARADVTRLQTVLESFGYYQGVVSIAFNGVRLDDPNLPDTLSALAADHMVQCTVGFVLGPLFRLGRVDIDGSVPEGMASTLGLSLGQPAVATIVLAAGARLQRALEDNGFAFAVVPPPVAYENPEAHTLDVRFTVRAGPRVVIGPITFTGLERLHESFLRTRLRVNTGDRYSAAALEKARQDLLATGVLSRVSVRLGQEPDDQDRLAVAFHVKERPRHAFAIRGAYSTDLGGSGGVTWSDRDVLRNAQAFNLSATAINLGGDATKGVGYDIDATYLIPDFGKPGRALQLAVGALQQSLQAYSQLTQSVGLTLRRKLSSAWSVSIGLSAAYSAITQEGMTHDYTLIAIPVAASYDSTGVESALSDPVRGLRVNLSIAPTLSRGHPNAQFVVTQAQLVAFVDLRRLLRGDAGQSVLALRVLGGIASGAGQFDLPPDQRFYAGGSATVRGYRYQSVGPQFADGNPTGGTALAAVGVEWRQRFGAKWGAAIFADGGEVSQSSDPVAGDFRVGIGTGIRYYTPIGPIRVDVALPVRRRPDDDRFEVYVGLGQAF